MLTLKRAFLVNKHVSIYRRLLPRSLSSIKEFRDFLKEVGAEPKEVRFWMRIFQFQETKPQSPFAVIHVNHDIFQHSEMMDKLCTGLRFLQHNEFRFVLVHGIETFRDTMLLTDMLERQGARVRPFMNTLVETRNSTAPVDRETITWSLKSGHIPIVPCEKSKLDQVVECVSAELFPLKVIYLETQGGIIDEKGKIVSVIRFPTDEDGVAIVDARMKEKVERISSLLSKLPITSTAVVSSPGNLLGELLTHKGSGTLLKFSEKLNSYKSLKEVDEHRLKWLLERSFGHELTPGYLSNLDDRLCRVYVTDSYSAVALVTNESEVSEVPYLCKFAVLPENQGLGSSETLWERLTNDFPSLFWRSSKRNRINPWYFAHAEGSWSSRDYITFWFGVENPSLSQHLIEFTQKQPSSFEGKSTV